MIVAVLILLGVVGAALFLFVNQTAGTVVLLATVAGMVPWSNPPPGGSGDVSDIGRNSGDVGSGPFLGN